MNVPLNGEDSLGEPAALKVRTSKNSQTNSSRSSGVLSRCDNHLSVLVLRPALLVACSLFLGSCSSVSSYVSDSWPSWAGGMPRMFRPAPARRVMRNFSPISSGRMRRLPRPETSVPRQRRLSPRPTKQAVVGRRLINPLTFPAVLKAACTDRGAFRRRLLATNRGNGRCRPASRRRPR